ARDPLFAHVMDRRSCKEPFADRPVAPDAALAALADVHVDPDLVAQVRKLTWDAWMVEATTYRTMKESTDLFRLGKAEVEANPDGIDFSGPFFETLILTGMMTREGSLDPESMEFAQGAAIYEEMLAATPAYAVIRTAANDRAAQIEAGRRWLRLNLTTTALGLSLHPVSQALQEYPEMAQHYDAAHRLLAEPGETVQMLGRLGYGPEVPTSPRWPVEAKVMAA
ncbi:MAG: twin-arginine translocation pathway signal protein, partial [Pseudomonadota bacterium]